MKNFKYILTLIVVIVLIVMVSKNWQTAKELSSPNIINDSEICYVWGTEAGDTASLRMSVSGGSDVAGVFDYSPAEKDSKSGPFSGIIGPTDENNESAGITADLLWTASGEGVTNTEQLSIKFAEGAANIGFGEMKLVEADGIYVYADPENISYSLMLNQTNCTNPAVK